MHERIERFFRRKRHPIGWGQYSVGRIDQEPSVYQPSDYQLLRSTDGYIADSLGEEGFRRLKVNLKDADPIVYEIGAARNVVRGIVFLDAEHTICIDPAYQWYEAIGPDVIKIPYGIFGGAGEKESMKEMLGTTLTNLQMPARIEGKGSHIVKGVRDGKERMIELIPEDGSQWLAVQQEESIPNMILWRAFPPSEDWGKVLAALKTGGFLITTGFGKINGLDDFDTIASGMDIDNSPLPRNGNLVALGLRPLTELPEIYFYQKVAHFPAEDITQAIRRNI